MTFLDMLLRMLACMDECMFARIHVWRERGGKERQTDRQQADRKRRKKRKNIILEIKGKKENT